jgi:hypothetical protein
MKTEKTRVRRTPEQLIKDLEAKIADVKARAARKRAKANPTTRYITAAVKAIDNALGTCGDATTKSALQEARTTLSSCMALDGVIAAPSTRARGPAVSPEVLLDYISKNPGQRGEMISAALGTDSKTIRPIMQKLIAEKRVKTKGERRAMSYQLA